MFETFVEELGTTSCRESLKIQFYFNFLLENWDAVSDEQGESFQQAMLKMKQCYQGRCDSLVIGDYNEM